MSSCIYILKIILNIYHAILVLGIFLTWLPFLYKYKFFRLIAKIGDWYMEPFTGFVVIGRIDFTPILGFFVYSACLAAIDFLL